MSCLVTSNIPSGGRRHKESGPFWVELEDSEPNERRLYPSTLLACLGPSVYCPRHLSQTLGPLVVDVLRDPGRVTRTEDTSQGVHKNGFRVIHYLGPVGVRFVAV